MKKTLIIAFIITVIAVPFAILADHDNDHTILQLEEKIKLLSKEIEEIEDKINTLKSVSFAKDSSLVDRLEKPSLSFNKNLGFGSRDSKEGKEVSSLQEALATDKEVYPEGLVTGYFGPLTERALKRFQAKHNIVSSGSAFSTGYGFFGPKTREKINQLNLGAAKSGDKLSDKKLDIGTEKDSKLKISLAADPVFGVVPLMVKLSLDAESFVEDFNIQKGTLDYFFDCKNDGVWDIRILSQKKDSIRAACTYLKTGDHTIRAKVRGEASSNGKSFNVETKTTITAKDSNFTIPKPEAELMPDSAEGLTKDNN